MSSILTVSQLNRYLAEQLKSDRRLQGKLIQGEISNFLIHPRSGHIYFTLKENDVSIKAVMFKEQAKLLDFIPENGMFAIVMANVRVYEKDGACQLYVTDIKPYGAGAGSLALEKLKAKLAAEGLFDIERKKKLPAFPEKIGVVTAKSGAALQDILRILSRRWPVAEVLLFPAFVQGEMASKTICAGIKAAGESKCDLVIVGRGGGSAEDLSAFNDEAVVRAISISSIPVISAVGHETDTTLSDLAADLRAPTPSAAAELSVPDKEEILLRIAGLQSGILNAAENCSNRKSTAVSWRIKQLEALSPKSRTAFQKEKIADKTALLQKYMNAVVLKKGGELSEKCAALYALNPLGVLKRGYAVVEKDGEICRTTDKLKAKDLITIKMSDGEIFAEIKDIQKSEG